MTWTNAFDAGACTVAVQYSASGDDTQLYNEVMTKGDSATFGGGDNPGPYTVEVSDSGEVSLSGDQLSSGGGSALALRVIPASIDGSCRVRGITVDVGYGGSSPVTAIANYEDPSSDVPLAVDPGSGWTPDPCDLPGAVEMSVYAVGVVV